MTRGADVVVVGGGQSALAAGYFLKRTGLSFVLLDDQPTPGGAWLHAWPSLRLFSPAAYNALPGWPMPAGGNGTPTREEVVAYLRAYEQRYALPVRRPLSVLAVERGEDGFRIREASGGVRAAKAVISATGTWRRPFVPAYPGADAFAGTQSHSAHYAGPAAYAGKRVLVVGGGNSGAQILAEVSQVAQTLWVTAQPPRFLPDDVDGRVLFERATERWRAQQQGRDPEPPAGGFGDIVMLPQVREARARGVLVSRPPFVRFTATGAAWADGTRAQFDAVIWCTGFKPALQHLQPLGVVDAAGRVEVDGSRALALPGLWLLGYGDWCGIASATLAGVTRAARATVRQVQAFVDADGDADAPVDGVARGR